MKRRTRYRYRPSLKLRLPRRRLPFGAQAMAYFHGANQFGHRTIEAIPIMRPAVKRLRQSPASRGKKAFRFITSISIG